MTDNKITVAERAVIDAAMNWYLAGLATGNDGVVKLTQAATPLRLAVYELRDAKGELDWRLRCKGGE